MTPLLSIVIITAIALAGSVFFNRFHISSWWMKGLAYSGLLYVLMGCLSGPEVLHILTVKVLDGLNILVTLVLGWVGFLVGLQTKYRGLKRFPLKYYLNGFINYLIAFVLSFTLLSLTSYLLKLNFLEIRDIFILSLTGAISSPIIIGSLLKNERVHAKLSYWLQFNAAFDNLLGVVSIGIWFSLFTYLKLDGQAGIKILRVVIPLLVAGMGYIIYRTLFDLLKSRQERLILNLGSLLVVVGTAYYYGQSILFVSFVFGSILANSRINTRALYRSVQDIEKPLYILLLFFAGAYFSVSPSKNLILLIGLYFGTHFISKIFMGPISNRSHLIREKVPVWIGIGNIGMGGLSLAMIIEYFLLSGAGPNGLLLSVLILSILINDLIAFRYLQGVVVIGSRVKKNLLSIK